MKDLTKQTNKQIVIRPAFNHLGNKARMISTLLDNFPKDNVEYFIEPFAGSGVVGVSYKTPKTFLANDFDFHLTEVLNYLFQNSSETIIQDIENIISQFNLPVETKREYKAEYNNLKQNYNENKTVEKLFVLILFGFNQQIRFNSEGNFNIPVGKFF